jgi:hypothetical protein
LAPFVKGGISYSLFLFQVVWIFYFFDENTKFQWDEEAHGFHNAANELLLAVGRA